MDEKPRAHGLNGWRWRWLRRHSSFGSVS